MLRVSGLILAGDALPSDVSLISLRARLALSRPFEIEVRFATADASWSPDDALFTHAAIVGAQGQSGPFHLDGIVHDAGLDGLHPEVTIFSLTIRPGLSALAYRRDSRVFVDQSRVDVIKKILGEAGVDEGTVYRLRETYEPRAMITQYRETGFDFISRLAELEGIFYTFEFEEGKHHLVFGDNADAFVAPSTPISIGHWGGASADAKGSVLDLKRTLRLRPSAAHLRDFDVKRPAQFPESVAPANSPVPILHFEPRGGFETGDAAKRVAAGRLAALRGDADGFQIETSSLALRPGVPFTLESARVAALSGEVVPVEVELDVSQSHPAVAGARPSAISRILAIPKGTRWAPKRSTPGPRIRGVQTATVTGPPGDSESIHTDSLGRVKIRFHWDRSGKEDDTTSAWVRVSQIMMGGAMILPRVGWEVAVGFEGGEPDRPIVLGRTYSAEEMPPYALPGEATATAFKTRSSPGGSGANEIKLGDSGGSQGFGVRAQKDMNSGVGNNKTEKIGGNETISVGGNCAVSIGASESLTVSGSQKISVGDAFQSKIGGSQLVTIGPSDTIGTTADLVESVGASRMYSVGGSSTTISNGIRTEIKGDSSLSVSSCQITLSAGTVTDTMLATYDETAGAAIVHAVVGSAVESSASKVHDVTAAIGHLCTNWTTSAADVTVLVGGLHFRKVGGDITISGAEVALGGGYGTLTGGGSSIKLGGGPVTVSGATKLEAAGIAKLASDLKLG